MNTCPDRLSEYQKKCMYGCSGFLFLMVVVTLILFLVWKVEDYKVYDRQYNFALIEYIPWTVGKGKCDLFLFNFITS